ncbi:putative transferase [Arabidopsis thaliana]
MDGHQRLKRALIMFTLLGLHLVQAQNQQGFISLDCGLTPNQSPYIEPTTKLNFSSDAGFIKSGKPGRIVDQWDTYKQYNALRYFPDGTRNCYNLKVNQGINYLIRAGFVYGNYDGLNRHPRFDVYLGVNLWLSMDAYGAQDNEIIHMAKSNSLQICLVKTGTTTPFISTLELRPLRNDTYSTQSGSLLLVSRSYYADILSNLRVR